jgi:hypothetical protein
MSKTGQHSSIIHTLRENIIKENDTATEVFSDYLKTLNNDTTEINVNISLQGDLDLSVLKKNQFNTVNSITFIKGDITNIRNVPENMRTLNISNNLLIEITHLPKKLRNLDVKNNYISQLDLKQTPNLEELDCGDNELTEIFNIPETLTSLLCSRNKLRKINLKQAKQLKILHISNNPSVIIENVPENMTNFEKDETADIIKDDDAENENKDKTKQKMKKIEYKTALNQFFKIKSKYEKELKKKKEKLREKHPNIKTYKKALINLKNKCIKCQRLVGTIFSLKNNTYGAVCGDATKPCELNISLYKGDYVNIENALYEFISPTDEINEMKDKIIIQKMDTLFNYISEGKSIELFKKKMETFESDAKLYEKLSIKHRDNYDNKEEKETLKDKNKQIYSILKYIKELLREYEKTNEKTVLQTVINVYQKELVPKIQIYNSLKYGIREIIKDEEENEILYQKQHKLNDIEIMFGEEPHVIRFVV